MISVDRVLSVAEVLYNVDTKNTRIRPLCEIVCAQVKEKMNKNTKYNDVRILTLCAAMLYYNISIKNSTSDDCVTSFKAGDVTVSVSPQAMLENAEKELKRATLLAASLLRDEAFIFSQVKI